MFPLGDPGAYARWAEALDVLDDADHDAIRAAVARLPRRPLFSLVTPPTWSWDGATDLIHSLRRQAYPDWELWVEAGLEPDRSDWPEWRDPRIRTYDRREGDAVGGFNTALALARGEFVIPAPDDAVLADQALFELAVGVLENPEVQAIYTDEDQMDASGRRFAPRFKTGWDPELMLGRDTFGFLAAYRTDLLRRLGGVRPDASSFELGLYDLSLRAAYASGPSRVVHLPAVLCHRTMPRATWDAEAARAIVREQLASVGEAGVRVSPAPLAPQWNRVERPIPDPEPLVSVIVPTRDGADLLARCAAGVLFETDYSAIELLIVDNGSEQEATFDLFRRLCEDPRVRVLSQPGPFNFSALNNRAAEQARGEVLLLLNNDTEVLEPGWLREMVSHAIRPQIGAVGAKLLYQDGRVQHAGVVFGPDGAVTHQLRLSRADDPGPDCELALTRTVLAVTGACLAVRRAVFLEVGGLDEKNLPIAFNDIDFCLRLGDSGYRVVWTPFATLLHLESISRGPDESPEKHARAMREWRHLTRTWGAVLETDPFHNQNLVLAWEHSTLAAPARRLKPWRRPLQPR